MRKVLALSLGALLVAGAAIAQEPAEVPLFFAVGVPAGNLPTIDGDGADWDWVDAPPLSGIFHSRVRPLIILCPY